MADRIAVMDQGVLQQVGSPIEVYNNPVNTFVARFLGSPSMNLLPGRLIGEGEALAVDLGLVGTVAAPRVSAGSPDVLFGIRPEDVAIVPSDASGALAMEVVFVERIGARTILHLAAGDHQLKAVEGNGYPVSVGERVGVRPDPERVRLFDRATGMALKPE